MDNSAIVHSRQGLQEQQRWAATRRWRSDGLDQHYEGSYAHHSGV